MRPSRSQKRRRPGPRPATALAAAAAALVFLAARGAPLLAQCALCKEALASSRGNGANWAVGFSWAIILLLGVLFSLAGGLVALIVYGARAGTQEPQGGDGGHRGEESPALSGSGS
jgi:hypothetical protein